MCEQNELKLKCVCCCVAGLHIVTKMRMCFLFDERAIKKKLLLTNVCRLSRNLCKFQNAFCQFLIFLQMEKRRRRRKKDKTKAYFAFCMHRYFDFFLSFGIFFCSFPSFCLLSNIQLKTSFNKQTNHSIWFDGLFSLGIGASVKSEYTE